MFPFATLENVITQDGKLNNENSVSNYVSSNYNRGQQGVFAEYPFMTPKYARNPKDVHKSRDNECRDTLARFYISVGDASPEAIKNYLRSVPPTALDLATVLVGTSKGPKGGTGFIDFFLQQVTESFTEVAQVDKVLGDNYVAFFFGQEPPVFHFSGTLLNSFQDDQRLGMAIAYQHLIRGTQLARRGALLRVRYDSVLVSGAIMSMTQTLNAENELAVPFGFTLLVKEYLVLTPPENIVTKVQDPFAPDAILKKGIGRISDVRSRTIAVSSKLSQQSVAGDDENAPTAVATPKDLTVEALSQRAGQYETGLFPGESAMNTPPPADFVTRATPIAGQ